MKNTKISYAQNREDIVIEAMLNGIERGVYVDIGANHPIQHSVTKLFYDHGWRGINIEPNPNMYALLKRYRPEDDNLNIGISDKEGKLKLRLYHSSDGLEGLSTFSDEIKADYRRTKYEEAKKFTDKTVPVKRLDTVLARHLKDRIINFMKVDVEGLEYEVLASNDWQRFRPQVLCIEANHMIKDWRPILETNNYHLIFSDGLNDYYVADECSEIDFSYPEVFLAGTRILDKNTYDREAKLEQLSRQYRKKLAAQRSRITMLEGGLYYLQSELDRQSSLRGQAKALYRLVDSRIQKAIEHRGYDIRARLPHVVLKYQETDSKTTLLKVARHHDALKYFRYRPIRTRMKIRYQVAGYVYRSARNTARLAAIKTYRLARGVK